MAQRVLPAPPAKAPADTATVPAPGRSPRARLPVWTVLGASGVVVALLVGALALTGTNAGVPETGGPPTTPGGALRRPAVNGDAMAPLPADQQLALEALARSSQAAESLPHDHAPPGEHLFGRSAEVSLLGPDQAAFVAEWGAAVAAVAALDTTEEAAAAGYVLSSTSAPGVGVHWVNWGLIAQPFDPVRPSMLLFSRVRGEDRLVGFSYWVQSPTTPEGFAGTNDHWHTHSGLCVVNGWVEREGVASPTDCFGTWLWAGDLWMLHAWVVPGFENRWGRLAPANPMLCPTGMVPDVVSCNPDTS